MTSTKDKHYWTQLRSALTAGQWSSLSPAKAPNGAGLPWSELLRKFNKHCRGYDDVAEIASQTRTLSLLLRSNSKDDDQDDPPSEGCTFPVALGNTCLLPEERIEEATAGYQALKKLECSNFDTLNFALAYYAYALGNPAECISYLENIPDLLNLSSHVPSTPNTRSAGAQALQIPSSATDTTSSASWTGSFVSEVPITFPEIKDGKAWSMTETLRSICLRGMAHEKLSPDDPEKAISVYSNALSLITIVLLEFIPSSSSPSNPSDLSTFSKLRELWRWVDTVIWRAVILLSRIPNINTDNREINNNRLWSWFSQYSSCSRLWPASFRTQHRSTICTLYLRALVLMRPPSSVATTKPWSTMARSVINDYREILAVSTKFPRAGERNIKVEEFVDLCVAVWEASEGSEDQTGWVIDVLWWATRLTFNSHRILRHMTHLLYLSGDIELAKRTLRLYAQVVAKAAQTTEGGANEVDTDRNWVLTLSEGAMMLCRAASRHQSFQDGAGEAKEALELVLKARTRLDKADEELNARADVAEAVSTTVLALTEQETHKRDKQLSHAHDLLLRVIETYPTPLAHFHLSLSFGRSSPFQDLPAAIIHAGLAVEGDPKEIKYWHLLGLLLAATESWNEAAEALEQGALIGEEEEQGTSNRTSGLPENVESRDFANVGGAVDGLPTPTSELPQSSVPSPPSPIYVLQPSSGDVLPPAAELLQAPPEHPKPSRVEMFERALQLRMTQMAIAEYVDGPEAAEAVGVQVFAWTGKQRGLTPNGRQHAARASISGSQPSHQEVERNGNGNGVNANTEDGDDDRASATTLDAPTSTIPIKISPASLPEIDSEQQPQRLSQSEDAQHSVTSKEEGAKEAGSLHPNAGGGGGGDRSRSKKVQQMLKNRVNKGQATIKKIGNGVVKTGGNLRRSNSTPDFHALLKHTSYQASSIHSRRRLSSLIRPNGTMIRAESPTPPPPVMPPPPPSTETQWANRPTKERRLISDLWLMTAATFRRFGKIEQAKGAIQEAEVVDEDNPAVWVQLGLYYAVLGRDLLAVESLQKALFLSPDDASATVHLCRLYLISPGASRRGHNNTSNADDGIDPQNVDMASGLLSHLTNGSGWDVPEAWYYLAKSYGMQGRREREKECLRRALMLSEKRGIREIQSAIGWCL